MKSLMFPISSRPLAAIILGGCLQRLSVVVSEECFWFFPLFFFFFSGRRDFWRSKILVLKNIWIKSAQVLNFYFKCIFLSVGFFLPLWNLQWVGNFCALMKKGYCRSKYRFVPGQGLGRCCKSPFARFTQFTSILTWQQHSQYFSSALLKGC